MLILAQYQVKPVCDARFLILNGREWVGLQRFNKTVFYPEEYRLKMDRWAFFDLTVKKEQFNPEYRGQLRLPGF